MESHVAAIDIEAAQKVIRQQLVLLLHAHSCQQRSQGEDQSVDEVECTLPYCKSTKEMINHMRYCQDSSECSFDHCPASQQIISHWKHCANKKRCQICGPVFVSQISNALNAMSH